MRLQRAEQPLKLDGLDAARDFFAGRFVESDPERECLWVAHVHPRARCIHLSRHEGEACSLAFSVRTIIADVTHFGSAGIVLAHNHPSGDSNPSLADCQATRRLVTAAHAIDCAVLDHLVFAGEGFPSLGRMALL
jgi:DNA repair protein RadC